METHSVTCLECETPYVTGQSLTPEGEWMGRMRDKRESI